MKLVDILARELTEWAGDVGAITQDKLTGELLDYYHCPLRGGNEREFSSIADDAGEAHDGASGAAVTRAEWQAAVDALNAPKVVEWDGVGSPQPGCSIEYSIGDGWYPCEVRYVLNRDDCPGIALIAWCEHLGKDQYLSNDRDHRFRAARTAEQVAAEEREKAIRDMSDIGIRASGRWAEAIYDAGYRKEPKPCGS